MSRDREKYPEKVPFRLTRMMQKAMEVTGIHGTYTMTCNDVMEVIITCFLICFVRVKMLYTGNVTVEL